MRLIKWHWGPVMFQVVSIVAINIFDTNIVHPIKFKPNKSFILARDKLLILVTKEPATSATRLLPCLTCLSFSAFSLFVLTAGAVVLYSAPTWVLITMPSAWLHSGGGGLCLKKKKCLSYLTGSSFLGLMRRLGSAAACQCRTEVNETVCQGPQVRKAMDNEQMSGYFTRGERQDSPFRSRLPWKSPLLQN